MPFYNGAAVAGLGVSKLSTSSITLATTATGATVNLIPGAGFKLSETADTAAFDVSTDNFTGYSVSLVAADDDQTLINTADSTKIINSIANPVEQTNFVTTNSALNNRWGVKPNKYRLNGSTITNTTTILPAPDREGIELDVTSSANSTWNRYSVAIGAMVDGTLAAGSYNRATNLVVTPNAIYYLINYADNTGDATVTNLPSAATSGSATVTSVNLDSTVPTRTGYVFDGWCLGTVSDDGAICTGTKYAAGANFGIDQTIDNTNITLYATWQINEYTITYGTVTGISSVSLDGTACTTALSAGGCTKTLAYNETYNLIATVATGYSFTSWSAGDYGVIANTTATGATTTYTVGLGSSIITPTAIVNQYTCTKQYRLQNADGTWGSYTTEGTEQVNYGDTCSYSKAVTNYTGVSGANSQAGTASGTMTENGLTLQISLYRNTSTITLTKGTGVSAVSVTGTGVKLGSSTGSATVYYGGTVTIGATLSSGYVWVKWTGSATYTTRSQSISNVTANLSFTANTSACSISSGKAYTFSYTGAAQTFTTPCYGNYKVELWGAQGGDSGDTTKMGASGAYVAGTILLNKSVSTYIYVGAGAGNNTTAGATAFNNGTGSSGGWSGGGSTDIRVTSGAWDNAASIRSRIMVAAGGGTTNSGNRNYAGAAGGLTGYTGTGGGTTGGTQVSLGSTMNTYTASSFGIANGGCTGGNGWYPSGGSTCAHGSGGGSSYISGHTGSVAVTSTASSSPKSGCTTGTTNNACSITPYINAATNAGYTFTDTVMIDGKGYAWTNARGSLKVMPNPSGGNYASGAGRTGNGYARITYLGSE